MAEVWDSLWVWMGDHTTFVWCLSVGSAFVFVLSLLLVPVVVARLPRDYFLQDRPGLPAQFRDRHPVIRWLLLIGKNLLGAVLVLGGIAMLAAPGQGVLTILIGLMLLNFPGKRQVEHWILSRSTVARLLNWIRRKRGREPFLFPPKKKRRSRNAVSRSSQQQA